MLIKKIVWRRLIIALPVVLPFSSCEDVIEVNLLEPETRLVVNGIVRVDMAEEFVDVQIRVKESSIFFEENTITQLESAVILIGQANEEDPFDLNFGTSVLVETNPGSGIYVPSYIPGTDTDDRIRTEFLNENTEFFLVIEHKGNRYAAQTLFSPTVPIDGITQGNETLFNQEETEVVVTFTDIPEQENYYVFDFGFGNFLEVNDEFTDGQQFTFSYFYDERLQPGTRLEISILGADQQFFNYIDLLLEQTENNGGVFQTPAATVRGNIFDVTGLDNVNIFDNVQRPNDFALGYFAVVQEFKQTIIIE
ncbi:Hypothetical protein I595_614 [Croceitalea dokdonensis DOKDO 023]|uniref:Uncharacterized protein n=1 Tax=Croceitalea dokdonensis DOKDO 023 TaxID=1300341 RepID=A0A0N8H4L5_9FLAO|nr:DUF4249 family protein [Croceitalea dokdonensis]KPM33708.1 Hypothetical protein I595_614 [Croceitalea dokdonensis DOKDO 023]